MKRNLLMGDQTLFRDPDIFEIDHVPEQFNFRDTQLSELAYAIRPAMAGGRPFNSVLRGLPGTGKTTSVRVLFSEIEQTTKRVLPVYINCKNDRTRVSIFGSIFNRIFGHYPPTTGIAFRKVYNEIGNYLSDSRTVAVVCLDDVNYLMYENRLNDILYVLLRLYEEFPGARLGVIAAVSNMEIDLMTKVDSAVWSVFRPVDIYFPAYGYEEVREILSRRVRCGLYPGAMSGEVLDLITQRTVTAGDLRVGLTIIKESVANAEKAARKEVLAEDVSTSVSAKDIRLRDAIGGLSPEEKKFLAVLAEVVRDSEELPTSGALYEVLNKRLSTGPANFYKRLNKLESMEIISLTPLQGRGQTREISLRYEVEEVLKVL
ncbi:orc1/cdc6 family replication initiation protein [Methanolacinia petrolearia DSM 11571]|uniref:ORC1-type DNA replication protein n=1 Tax=Methanolacinia petrolearia (strain DSM 11571 / OCM 486 / SEBR 4847) TaxID=679926 RepID=E1RJH2_METP4|nr:ORC1-type DNA replication protein [Methanolacinia petrolearia]ADN36778.1 orc1/cdc6 family replication initiation protein [Methanolacinia petrolearia DSM 11571]